MRKSVEEECFGKFTHSFQCHSSTKKEEIIEFIKKFPNRIVTIHHDVQIGGVWDDESIMFNNTEKEFNRIKKEIIDIWYIHGVYILDDKK